MVKLTERLRCIANYMEPGESMADIGTDHGFLPICLCKEGRTSHVILSDINEGPLEKARENIRNSCDGSLSFDIRLGNGIETLKSAEVDCIVIAGMGGMLIIQILEHNLEKSKSYKKIILQPRNAQEKLRRWLLTHGFYLVSETLVREGKYLWEVILAVPEGQGEQLEGRGFYGEKRLGISDISNELDFEINPLLYEKKDPLLNEYIENKLRIERRIYKQLAVAEKEDELRRCEKRIILLKEALEKGGEIR